jgi:hypothetical protein
LSDVYRTERMIKLAAAEPQGEWSAAEPQRSEAADAAASRMVARVRWLMIISGLTTLIAIAAVIGVVGYRVYHAGGNATAAADTIVTVPKGARIVSTAVADDRIVVTLDAGGTTEIVTLDIKTLRETGRVRFAPAP